MKIIFYCTALTPVNTYDWLPLIKSLFCSTALTLLDTYDRLPQKFRFDSQSAFICSKSAFICSANQWTGFYMITAPAMKELTL